MKSNKYENLKSLEKRKTKEREMKDDIRHKGKRIENQLLKSKIALEKILSKTQDESISLEKLRQIKTQKISNSISPFEIKFPFDYFFSSLMPFKFRHLSFGGPPLEIILSSLLFSSILSAFQKKKWNKKNL